MINAHAYRWEQISRYWVTQGYQVDVITSRVKGALNQSVDAGVNVTRVGSIKRSITTSSGEKAISGLHSKILSCLINRTRPLYRKLYWPDALWHWIPSVVFEVLSRRNINYDLVVSYYPCLGAHFAALALQRWTRYPGMKWRADYGDPFSTSITMPPNNFAIYRNLNLYIEKLIARRADSLVFTNDATASEYQAAGCEADKLRIIPHLVDIEKLYANVENKLCCLSIEKTPKRAINLLYIGGFHRGIREPDLLFDVVKELNKSKRHTFIVNIFGPENGFNLSPSDCPYIVYKGIAERENAFQLMREADVLVNVDNKKCVMVPSKIVEYIGTGRPIINLHSEGLRHSAMQNYADHGFAMFFSRNDLLSGGAKSVEEFILTRAGLIASLDVVNKVLDGYKLEDVAISYENLK